MPTKKTDNARPAIQDSSPTGISALDEALSGGFPTGAVVLLAGPAGSGKTILSFQWLFEGVKNGEHGIYITATESILRSVKSLETLSFYDPKAMEQGKLSMLDLRDVYETEMVETRKTFEIFEQRKIIDSMATLVKKTGAKRLCLDSMTAMAYNMGDKAQIRTFIFDLGKALAALGCTAILTSEMNDEKKLSEFGVEEFISDVIIRLNCTETNGRLERMLQIAKVRGREYETGGLFFHISRAGITIFPKIRMPLTQPSTTEKISTGNIEMDGMLLGGIFRGASTIAVGATGTGKSLLSMQFINEGLRKGEPCLYVGFEESRDQLVRNANGFGWNFDRYEKDGLLSVLCSYPNERYLDEHLVEIARICDEKNIKRCVVDSLSAVFHSFPDEDFLSFARQLNSYLKGKMITGFFTVASIGVIGTAILTEGHLSTVADNIIMLRHAEIEGKLCHVLNIVKVRGGAHSKGLKMYEITDKGLVMGQSLVGYEGMLTGSAKMSARP